MKHYPSQCKCGSTNMAKHSYLCVKCHREQKNAYYAKNKEKMREYRAKYRSKPEVQEKIKAYRQKPETKERMRLWMKANRLAKKGVPGKVNPEDYAFVKPAPPIDPISVLSLPYIAGFVDGEGCIAIDKAYGIHLLITNTHRPVLDGIQQYFNGYGKVVEYTPPSTFKRTKVCYHWTCWGKEAKEVLLALYPYLIIKREQCRLTLLCYKTVINKREWYAKWGGAVIPSVVKSYRYDLYKRVRELKRCCA